MKTKISIFVTLTSILVMTVFCFPANAQRRTSHSGKMKYETENNNTNQDRKDKKTRVVQPGTNQRTDVTAGRRNAEKKEQHAQKAKSASSSVRKNENTAVQERRTYNRSRNGINNKPHAVQPKESMPGRPAVKRAPASKQPEGTRYTNRKSPKNPGAVSPRARAEHQRTVYRVNPNDNRYKYSNNYNGNKNSWSMRYAPHHIHYSKKDLHYYRSYDHRKYMHWDRKWESYHWTVNSWKDHYSGYHPYSYRFHKNYYYHPGFGHVIRKFSYKPAYFVHNNIRFYNYNGHFFRHFRGIGYVLVDMPYGLVFHKLQPGYEKVYINGYLYFRAGNLFFEASPNGYALIHYPERYLSLNEDYQNEGFYRSTDYIIDL